MSRVQRAIVALLLVFLTAQVAVAAEIVYLVRTGTDSTGGPLFRPADSRDTYLSGLFELTNSSRAMTEVARYYDSIQRDKLAASLENRGLSEQDKQYALQNFKADPIFIEVNNSTNGAYNDWKGKFSVQYSNGQVASYSTPRVVYALGSDVARSGNRGLIEQTLVHEVAHGGMCQCHGSNALPETPWLSKPHSGGSVTDEQLAYIEGWAEFVGAYFTGRRTIAEDPANAIDSNWYAKRADGSWKSPSELVRTEGWNATILYKIATEGRDQNAMWKMTQVMTRVKPQSSMQMLQYTAQYFPELAPTINAVVNRESGGQIPQVVQGATYATGGGGQNYGNTSTVPTNYAGGGTGNVDRLAQALYGGGSSAYAGYAQYQGAQGGYAQGGQSGYGSAYADSQQLAALYQQKRAQLDQVPWWKFWEKSKIKKEISMIESLYAKQTELTAAYSQGGYGYGQAGYGQAGAPVSTDQQQQAVAPAAPTTAKKTYSGVVDSLSSGDSGAAAAALEAHKAAFQGRKALKTNGPTGER